MTDFVDNIPSWSSNIISEYYEVERIIAQKRDKKTRKTKYLIKWKNYHISKSTWEPRTHLKCDRAFTNFKSIQRKPRKYIRKFKPQIYNSNYDKNKRALLYHEREAWKPEEFDNPIWQPTDPSWHARRIPIIPDHEWCRAWTTEQWEEYEASATETINEKYKELADWLQTTIKMRNVVRKYTNK